VAIISAADEDRPSAQTAVPQKRSRADGAIVDAAYVAHDFPDQDAAKNQAEPPAQERRQHRKQNHEGHSPTRRPRDCCQPAYEFVDRRRSGDDESANDDHRHLHGKRNQSPESVAEILDQIAGPDSSK
jgi:hypothetical protein